MGNIGGTKVKDKKKVHAKDKTLEEVPKLLVLFINNLRCITKGRIFDMFGKFGCVQNVAVYPENMNAKMALITFEEEAVLLRAKETVDSKLESKSEGFVCLFLFLSFLFLGEKKIVQGA